MGDSKGSTEFLRVSVNQALRMSRDAPVPSPCLTAWFFSRV